jgi:ferredoxin-NADP reductase
MNVTFDHSQAESDNIRTFYFKPERPLHYTAGQFTELTINHKNPDARGQKHWFTLSSSPTEELLSITTKWANDRQSSFKKALWKLKPGDEVQMSDAMGDFVLPQLIQTPLIFVAGGIGITPFHSILAWLADRGETRPIRLLYAVRNENEIIFQKTFEKAGVQPTIVVSQPSEFWGGERGQLTAETILGIEEPDENTLVYVSGPEPMVESLEKDLKKSGVKQSRLVLDFFPNYPSY